MRLLNYLNEKQIIINNGQKYGQVVLLGGGSGSGKGYATTHFIERDKFKVIDVDDWKRMFLVINQMTREYPELNNLDLSKPKDVQILHKFVKERDIRSKVLNLLFQDKSKDVLPNIMFDITFKDFTDVESFLPQLERMGYDNKNIHVVWVLTNYSVAIERNRHRSRIVPDDIILKTHEGVVVTMLDIIKNGFDGIDGSIVVIINNPDTISYYVDDKGNPILNTKGEGTIKDFVYLTIKKSGKPPIQDDELKSQLLELIKNNIPKSLKTKEIFDLDKNDLY